MEIQPELIERCQKGDRKAENELYKILYSFLLSICLRYIRQDEKAREMLNIGFCRTLLNINKYKPVAPFQYWARRIMINVLINEHKKEKLHYGHHNYVETYNDDKKYSEINAALEKFNMNRIEMCIEKLPPASRQVFNLFIIDGYSHAEIAGMLSISEGTSKWHLNAAREKLKEMLVEKKIKLEI
ncbi:RNA polymerase sigma factor [Aurantibacillus circumpalustris]|uniref:RNA polymerase sigma factor n=1 Tax=Aurantibacillus circumpalustris TaxID=3036359 RepID=UPI00295AEF1A|nr:RNA polymerase sigma factor [Aurantibacillus circumpalustris]